MSNEEFYALADQSLAKRMGGFLWLMGAVIITILLPLSPPDESDLGDAGWAVGVGLVGLSTILGIRLLRHADRVSSGELLAQSYVAISVIGVLMWLAGAFAAYVELGLIATLYVAAIHPPRRVLPFLAIVALVLASPLFYAYSDTLLAGQVGRFLVWMALAFVAIAFTARVRMQRAGLRQEGDEARVQARADPLTELGNRRAFDEALVAATLRADRTGSSLSVIVIDIDSFKVINDNHGLVAGDRCLREVAEVLREGVRRPDSCFRWGGDEFVVLADVDRAGIEQLSIRLAGEVAVQCPRPDGSPMLLHTGAAEFGRDGSNAEELLIAASRALKPAEEQPAG